MPRGPDIHAQLNEIRALDQGKSRRQGPADLAFNFAQIRSNCPETRRDTSSPCRMFRAVARSALARSWNFLVGERFELQPADAGCRRALGP
jgi:hypothetical protein